MVRHYFLYLLLLVITLLTGCSLNWGSLRIATSQNIPMRTEVLRKNATGKDCVWQFIFIPLGKLNPNIEAAITDAINTVPDANALTNIAVYQDLLITFIVNQSCVRVVGDAVRVPGP